MFAGSKGLFAMDESNPTCNNLNAMQVDTLMFSFAQAIQQSVMSIWHGEEKIN
ncbi:MAG TPA: hypothetical protein VMU83_19715 [Hanamia sp.]|nr:hypothetical protein [Hanamia sp.]